MDSPQRIPNKESQPQPQPQVLLSPCGSRKRRLSTDSNNSPEFEFWMLRNPSFPQPNLLSADELFVDGVLLPLHHLHLNLHLHSSSNNNNNGADDENNDTNQDDPPDVQVRPSNSQPEPAPQISAHPPPATLTASKRWKDIFSKKSAASKKVEDKDKEKKRSEKKTQTSTSTSITTPAELNINIWPFSRSRSAGNSGSRPKMAAGAPGTRKVSSAPCSRSNSAGESKSRKWPSSPGRAGVHLGRSSPVWQVRRGGGSVGLGGSGLKSTSCSSTTISNNNNNNYECAVRIGEKGSSKKQVSGSSCHGKAGVGGASTKVKVLNLNVNVPMCIGYCRSHENSTVAAVSGSVNSSGGKMGVGGGGSSSGDTTSNVENGGGLFNLRSLFTKKVY